MSPLAASGSDCFPVAESETRSSKEFSVGKDPWEELLDHGLIGTVTAVTASSVPNKMYFMV